MDSPGSGMSTVRPTTSSEVRPRVGEEGMDEGKIKFPKGTIGEATCVDPRSIDNSSERHSQRTVTSLIIHSYPSN